MRWIILFSCLFLLGFGQDKNETNSTGKRENDEVTDTELEEKETDNVTDKRTETEEEIEKEKEKVQKELAKKEEQLKDQEEENKETFINDEKKLKEEQDKLKKDEQALEKEKQKFNEKNSKKLKPYLMVIGLVPTDEDKKAIATGPDSDAYGKWTKTLETQLAAAYEASRVKTKTGDKILPVVNIEQVDLTEVSGSDSLRVAFYVNIPGKHLVPKQEVKLVYGELKADKLGDFLGRQVLMFPVPADSKGASANGASRTLSIIAFVMGWMCLAALIVILAYLAIKYRDGIKSLAKRIEYWSNPNRNGYSNLGGDTMSADWRSDITAAEDDTRPFNTTNRDTPPDMKPKKKLRAPGGLLADEGDVEVGSHKRSYGTYQDEGSLKPETMSGDIAKDTAHVRLSDLAGDGEKTPPLTPKSMQKHLIKKYQDKQAEEYTRQTNADDVLTASNSEVFPDDFEDCVEEEIFNMKP